MRLSKHAEISSVAQVMHRNVLTVTKSMPASDALALMRDEGVRHAVVREDEPRRAGVAVVGVVSERDIRRFAVRPGHTWLVHDVMTAPPIVVAPDTKISEAAHLFRARRIGCLPVVLGSTLVGIVTRSDLLAVIEGGEAQRSARGIGAAEIPRPVRCRYAPREK